MPKYWIYPFYLIFFLNSTGWGQAYSITGRVFAESHPLPDAVVVVDSIVTKTDAAGYFKIDGLGSGGYRLKIGFTGYSPFMRIVAIQETGVHIPDITLERIQELPEVSITDSYAAKRKRETPMSVDVVNSEYIRRNLGGSLMKSLEKLPGVKSIGIGSGSSKPLIRGLGFNQVVVLENGIKHEGQQWGTDHGLEIDQYAADRVEILKGAASFIYGSDAIAGAIEIKSAPVPSKHTSGGSIDLAGKTNNLQSGVSVNLFSRKEKLVLSARFTGISYGDFQVPADTVYVYSYAVGLDKQRVRNTAGSELNAHLTAGWITDKIQSIFYGSRVHHKSGFFANAHGLEPRRVDGLLHDRSSRDVQLPSQEVTHHKLLNRTVFRFQNHQLMAELGFQKNFRQEWSSYVNHGYMPPVYPESMTIPSTLERQFDKMVFSGNLRDEISLGNHVLTLGANGEYQRNTIGGWGFLIPSFDQRTFAVYAYDKVRIGGSLLLHAALRFDHGAVNLREYSDWFSSALAAGEDSTKAYLQRAPALSRNFNSLNWSAGVNYQAGNIFLNANAGTSFRMPIAKELGANGVNYHYFRYEKGDPGLSPEVSYQLDIGIGYRNSKWSAQVSPFFNYFPNYIFLNPTPEHDYYYGAGNQVFYYTQSRVARYGSELQITYDFLPRWSAAVAGEYLYNEQLSGAKKGYGLPFTPPVSALLNISYRPVFKRHVTDSYISLDYRMSERQDRIVPPEKKTPGYHVLHLSAGTKTKLYNHPLLLDLQVRNMLNTRYSDHTSFYRLIELPEPGRNIIVSIKIPFTIKSGKAGKIFSDARPTIKE